MVCGRFGMSTFRLVDVLGCRRFGLSTSRSVDVSVWSRFGLSTFWPVTYKRVHLSTESKPGYKIGHHYSTQTWYHQYFSNIQIFNPSFSQLMPRIKYRICLKLCPSASPINHFSDAKWALRHLSSIASGLFVHKFVQADTNIKDMYYWPFVRRIYRWPVDSPHKGPVMRKAFPCHDVIMDDMK